MSKKRGTLFVTRTIKPSIEKEDVFFSKLKRRIDRIHSELEKQVLDEIIKQKLRLPDEAQKLYTENDVPITKADFFYNPDTYVFIDGPPHAPENVQR